MMTDGVNEHHAIFKIRLIRLHPLVILGVIIGAIGFWFDPFTNLGHQVGIVRIIVSMIIGFHTPASPRRSRMGRNAFAGRTLLVVITGVYRQPDLCAVWKKNDKDYFVDYRDHQRNHIDRRMRIEGQHRDGMGL